MNQTIGQDNGAVKQTITELIAKVSMEVIEEAMKAPDLGSLISLEHTISLVSTNGTDSCGETPPTVV